MACYCPHCYSHDTVLVNTEVEHEAQICQTWVCRHCKCDFNAEYEFSGFYDADGNPIVGGDA
ncbi:MAG: hypothetical protein WC138_12365 [Methanoculleus sp.]|jgi:transposase-like protein